MLNVLLESRASKERRRGGTLTSVVVHAAIIATVVAVTAQKTVGAAEAPVRPEYSVTIFELKPRPQTTSTHASTSDAAAPVVAPSIPSAPTPTIDFSRIPTGIPDGLLVDPSVASVPTGTGTGLVTDPYGGSGLAVDPGSVVDERYVDRSARLTAAPSPRYPDRMRAMGIEGRVLVQFVVDTTGRVELAGVKVLESAHDDLAIAVRQVLPRLRFVPAEVRGQKVRMLAQMPFEFALDRR